MKSARPPRPFLPRRASRPLLVALPSLLLGACSAFESVGFAPNRVDETAVREAPTPGEPPRVEVQHVLIAFEGTGVAGVTRTKEEAERLAAHVFEQARAGRNFDELVRLYSDDRHGGGFFRIANFGVPAAPDETERGRLVRAFSRAAFSLEPGALTLVPWEEGESPFGWHVIRRLR